MDSTNVIPLIEQLDNSIDDLEEALSSFIENSLSDTASKLPLLDKAQLYVLITYAIESILFSFLRLNGVDAKAHPVFQELRRVKQYFDKINAIESGDSKREHVLNKPAAGRFIKHALAGNGKHDLERVQQRAGVKAKAHLKFEKLTNKRKCNDDRILNPNSELIGAASSPSSSSPIVTEGTISKSGIAVTSAPSKVEVQDGSRTIAEQGMNKPPLQHSLLKESRSVRKRRKRENGSLSHPKSNDLESEGSS